MRSFSPLLPFDILQEPADVGQGCADGNIVRGHFADQNNSSHQHPLFHKVFSELKKQD